jgi:hypothetical protein
MHWILLLAIVVIVLSIIRHPKSLSPSLREYLLLRSALRNDSVATGALIGDAFARRPKLRTGCLVAVLVILALLALAWGY